VGNLVKGEVIHVDRFGNLITNVAGRPLNNSQDVAVSVNKNPVRFAKTFGDVNIGDPVAYWGSGGLLEIAVREGSALQRYGGKGLPVEVVKFA
jgi:S-adenosylmethionine hydrolase